MRSAAATSNSDNGAGTHRGRIAARRDRDGTGRRCGCGLSRTYARDVTSCEDTPSASHHTHRRGDRTSCFTSATDDTAGMALRLAPTNSTNQQRTAISISLHHRTRRQESARARARSDGTNNMRASGVLTARTTGARVRLAASPSAASRSACIRSARQRTGWRARRQRHVRMRSEACRQAMKRERECAWGDTTTGAGEGQRCGDGTATHTSRRRASSSAA